MPDVQKFGVVYNEKYLIGAQGENFDYRKYKSENDLLIIEDDLIEEICINRKSDFNKIKTYFCSLNRPNYGLASYAITLIPPKSLEAFKEIIVSENIKYKSKKLELLINKIDIAIKNKKYMVHFGN